MHGTLRVNMKTLIVPVFFDKFYFIVNLFANTLYKRQLWQINSDDTQQVKLLKNQM